MLALSIKLCNSVRNNFARADFICQLFCLHRDMCYRRAALARCCANAVCHLIIVSCKPMCNSMMRIFTSFVILKLRWAEIPELVSNTCHVGLIDNPEAVQAAATLSICFRDPCHHSFIHDDQCHYSFIHDDQCHHSFIHDDQCQHEWRKMIYNHFQTAY